ncbi:MAG: hypothetical protein MZV63_21790 [Marinilabiliales bacterium]|nr:hypothetical protein [Marinilabiliales bacterium]
MQNTEDYFDRKVMRVPVDSTWTRTDSISISPEGDTTWFVTAEKLFGSVDEINEMHTCQTAGQTGK